LPRDRVHEMCLAEADAAMKKQGVERRLQRFRDRRLGKPLRGGMGEFVGFADDEILEGKAWIERGHHAAIIAVEYVARRSGNGGGSDIAVIGGREARHHDEIDRDDAAVFLVPQDTQPVAVMLFEPVARELRRHRDLDAIVGDAQQRHRLEPVVVNGLAVFGAQSGANARPLCLDFRRKERALVPGLSRRRHLFANGLLLSRRTQVHRARFLASEKVIPFPALSLNQMVFYGLSLISPLIRRFAPTSPGPDLVSVTSANCPLFFVTAERDVTLLNTERTSQPSAICFSQKSFRLLQSHHTRKNFPRRATSQRFDS